MSKKTKSSSDFTYKTSQPLPTLKKITTDWDLKKHYYKSEKDPLIETHLRKAESAYAAFVKKYESGRWQKSLKGTIQAINDYLALTKLPGDTPLYYLFYRRELNASDEKAEQAINMLEARATKLVNTVIFFEHGLSELPKKTQKALLSDSRTEEYRYFLESVFKNAQYQLSVPEEKIMNLKSATSRGMWIAATEKILNKKSIQWKGNSMPINGALMQFESLSRKDRHAMWDKIIPVLKEVGEVAENEMVALIHDKKISDELRGYKNPYSVTTKNYDSNDETLEKLVEVIETRGYALSKKYYKLRKNIIGKELDYIDRDEPLGKTPEIPFEQAVEITRDVFYQFNPAYGKIFDTMLQNGQLDVWPKAGRGSGAFCSSGPQQPTFVFLNHNNSVDSLRTLAHEMGHAIHAYRSKKQPTYYEGHSILTAETASTFFESLVAERIIAEASGKQKMLLLDSFISNKISTMIMCIARYKCELALHKTIRERGAMTYMEMATQLANEFKKYCGPAIKIEPTDGLSVVWKTHYRRNFYQYSYSFGEIGSSIMRNRYRQNKDYSKEVDTFLSLGDSKSVEDIFKTIGIDMTKTDTFNEALDLLEADILELTRLAKQK